MNDAAPRMRTPLAAMLLASAAAIAASLMACHSSSPRSGTPPRALPPAETREPLDASYDWHGLLIVPFGSLLKDVPLPLHEVLLFRDEARSASPSDDPECYGIGGPAPRFVGRSADEYLLCFTHDRLSRIAASVRLTSDRAARVFADACGLWLKNASAPATVSTPGSTLPPPSAAAQGAAAGAGAGACEGRDGSIRFNGRLVLEPDQPEAMLTLTLDTATDR